MEFEEAARALRAEASHSEVESIVVAFRTRTCFIARACARLQGKLEAGDFVGDDLFKDARNFAACERSFTALLQSASDDVKAEFADAEAEVGRMRKEQEQALRRQQQEFERKLASVDSVDASAI